MVPSSSGFQDKLYHEQNNMPMTINELDNKSEESFKVDLQAEETKDGDQAVEDTSEFHHLELKNSMRSI